MRKLIVLVMMIAWSIGLGLGGPRMEKINTDVLSNIRYESIDFEGEHTGANVFQPHRYLVHLP